MLAVVVVVVVVKAGVEAANEARGSLAALQLLTQILLFDTLGTTSCLCIRLLIALNRPPWVGKKK